MYYVIRYIELLFVFLRFLNIFKVRFFLYVLENMQFLEILGCFQVIFFNFIYCLFRILNCDKKFIQFNIVFEKYDKINSIIFCGKNKNYYCFEFGSILLKDVVIQLLRIIFEVLSFIGNCCVYMQCIDVVFLSNFLVYFIASYLN